jgi:hypothetical protein
LLKKYCRQLGFAPIFAGITAHIEATYFWHVRCTDEPGLVRYKSSRRTETERIGSACVI